MKIKLYILFFLISTSLFAQKVTTAIDVTKNKIGAEFKLTLKTDVDTLSKVKFPEAKNFGALEVIQSYKMDTVKNGGRYQLIKKYGLTQFDSGQYVIPRIPVVINGKPIFSDSIKVEVNAVKVDTLKQKMYDIKDIALVESPLGNWWIYLLILLAIAVLGFFIYKYIKKRQSEPKVEEVVYKSPIEKATTLLQQLEKKELWQKGEIKHYYSELTDIARNYIEEEIHIPAMESTTSELIEGLRKASKQKKLKLSNETVENLEKVLKQADLVKFAKVKPLDFEIEEDKKRISNSIVTIHKSIPEVVEEDDELLQWNEQQKELARLQKLKKQKRVRIISTIGIVLGMLMLSVLGLIYFKGFDYVKDNFLGHPTKDLVEGKWIYSEYGNPGVRVETPKVLKRIDVATSLPKDAMAMIKEMQTFGYGSLLEDFYITVSTVTYKQETQIDLDKTAEGYLKIMEAQGAQNIIVKTEDFDTQKGIAGKKAYGTMSVLDKVKGKSTKMYYELLLFSQNGGLQTLLVMHREEDKYGQQIAERMLNSVELQTTTQE
ncbi:BatD family protein [Flavobacterium sp. 25HG05S-40]|uniref:BatD family protein n=1 Tax=Flavobacterium sp. 25HG05S-40 TaxID=3458682 RepID=UPI00404412BA